MNIFIKLLIISMMSFVYADCSEIDNQEECDRVEGCEWSDNAGCLEGEWEDDEEGEDEEEDWGCEEIENQLECEYSEGCEWIEGSCQTKDESGESLNNSSDVEYNLLKNYPNPFNPETTINFAVVESGNISIKIYDISGKEVNNLINGFYSSGNYSVNWNATDNYGQKLSSGIYIYQLNTQQGIHSKRMVLMR